MDDLEMKARGLLDKLYAGEDVDRNFESLCALMRPIIWKRAKHFIKCMEGYEYDDFYQEACIVIWRIVLVRKPEIHTSVLGYLSCSIYYEYLDLYYEYALKNVHRVYTGSDYENPALGYYRAKEIDFVKRRREKIRENARRRYLEKYIEEHGYSPDQAPPKPVLTEEERKAQKREYWRSYSEKNRGKRNFLYRERSRIERSGVVRAFRLSARPGDPDKNESEYVLIEGESGGPPLGATLSIDEYRHYLERKYSGCPADMKLDIPHSFDEMLALADKNGILLSDTRISSVKKPEQKKTSRVNSVRRSIVRKESTEAQSVAPRKIEKQRKWKDRKEYYQANKARIRERSHVYYVANREKIIKASLEYYQAHRDEISALNKEYYWAYHDYVLLKDKRRREEKAYLKWLEEKQQRSSAKSGQEAKQPRAVNEENEQYIKARNRIRQRAYRSTHSRDAELEKARAHYMEHRDEITAKRRAERAENHDEVIAKQRAYHHKHKDKINAQRRDYYQKNKEKFKEYNRKYLEAKKAKAKADGQAADGLSKDGEDN